MDTNLFIKNLRQIFCNSYKHEKKYSEAWLSQVDFGGLYVNGQYVLNVKVEHEIDSRSNEIEDILQMLNEHAKNELAYIWSINVLGVHDEVHCDSGELLVYAEETSCL